MELEVADKILELAKEGGFLEGDIQADPAKKVGEAEYFLREAESAIEQGWGYKEPAVCAIIELATGKEVIEPDEYPPDIVRPRAADDPEPDMTITSEPDAAEVVTVIDADEFAAAATTYQSLPIPPDIAEAVVTLPSDLTGLTDVEVRRYHSQFNSLLARATWVLSQASNDLAAAEHLFDAAYRKALKSVDKIDPYTEKAKIAKVLEAETMEDITVMAKDDIVQVLKANVVSLKALRDVYASNVSTTSREWTMRQDEYEKGR